MDKNSIKKYAVWARRELIARVSQKALRYGITEKESGDPNADNINGTLLTSTEKKQRKALISQITEKSYEQVMEEVAYTWFNRFSALRFMEVNGHLPSHVRVFTDEDNNFKPQIITEAIHLELDGLNMEKVYALKDENMTDELYKYLLITQCNALSSILPGMFQKIEDYSELLFPENLLRDGSVIQQMIELIPEDDWKDAVQIIGWLYQYYNSEKKDDVFAALKKNVKITKENIPAATQLFTPDWIVRYMVENSLGRLWVEGHPNDELKAGWKYYLEEAEQEPEVEEQLVKIRREYKGLKPEDIKCIDPCCGSGHILAYLFDVLMQIYEAYGYTTREAVASIVENNIYGLDIDDRAAQLANFAIMMKARQYDRRFFSHVVQPKVYAIVESNHIDSYTIDYFANGDAKLEKAIKTIVNEMHDAKEYGSILTIAPQDWSSLYKRFDEIEQEISMYKEVAISDLLPVAQVAQALSEKYEVVTTNPPYMGNNGMSSKLSDFIKSYYPDSKGDLFAVFIERCAIMIKNIGLCSMITQHAWMFLASYENIRNKMMAKQIVNMAHLGPRAFDEISGEVVQTTSFTFTNKKTVNYISTYVQVTNGGSEREKERIFLSGKCRFYKTQEDLECIQGTPYTAYWASDSIIRAFSEGSLVGDYSEPRVGMATANNDRFIRLWFEVNRNKFGVNLPSRKAAVDSKKKWFPFAKGGEQRRWYGNNDTVVNWENDGFEIQNFKDEKTGRIRSHNYNLDYIFNSALTWTVIGTDKTSFRFCPIGFLYSNSGYGMFCNDEQLKKFLLGFMNSKIAASLLQILSPSMGFESGYLRKLPLIRSDKQSDVVNLVEESIAISKTDWDSFETSWDFTSHPLISIIAKNRTLFDDVSNIALAECFTAWENECNERFNHLKADEEELNRIFIDIYGLQDELTPEVEDKDVTVRKADLQLEVKSLISYTVGCMFGRYSLEKPGLVYAGGDFESVYDKFVLTNQNMSDYTHAELSSFSVDELKRPFFYLRETQNKPLFSLHVDADNIIPICSDEYFTNDIVGRFVKFIETVYGKKALDRNLKFIADALGGKGQPIDVIRNYFINDFYADHCKIYQKRPIYWLFDSGKKGGFKALIYMHRYQQDTIARMRTDYVHEQQGRYRTEISDLETRIAGASTSERVKLNKQLFALQDKATEIRQYEEKIHHLADQMIRIDLDDGVKNNYAIFQDVLAKIK